MYFNIVLVVLVMRACTFSLLKVLLSHLAGGMTIFTLVLSATSDMLQSLITSDTKLTSVRE
jgi:hypothetical protein